MNFFKVTLLTLSLVGSAFSAPQLSGGVSALDDEPFNPNPQYSYRYQVADDGEQTYINHEEARDGEDVTGSYQYVDPFGSLIKVTYRAGAMGYTEEREVQENFVAIRSRPATTSSQTTTISSSSGANRGSAFGSRNEQTTTTTTSSSGSSSGGLVSQVVSAVRPAVEQVVTTETQSTESDSDLVARILAQLTPFIQQTVSSSLAGQQGATRTTTTRRVSSAPVATRVITRPVAAPQAQQQQVTRTVTTSSSSSGNAVTDLFGVQGANNVQFASPDSNYEFNLQ